MDKPELEARCFELYPDHPMLRLRACDEILKRGIADEKEAGMLEGCRWRMDGSSRCIRDSCYPES